MMRTGNRFHTEPECVDKNWEGMFPAVVFDKKESVTLCLCGNKLEGYFARRLE